MAASCDDDFGLLGEEVVHQHQQQAAPSSSFAHRYVQKSAGIRSVGAKKSAASAGVTGQGARGEGVVVEEEEVEEPEDDYAAFGQTGVGFPNEQFGEDTNSSRKPAPPPPPPKRRDRDDLTDGDYYFITTAAASKKARGSSAAAAASSDYRKDREEWSDSAISTLLDAYTERFEQLNRGNLRGRDWEDVAAIVSERCCDNENNSSSSTNNNNHNNNNNKHSSSKAQGKSVEQCKNKIDNLKKRYKVECQRLSNSGLAVSHWPWFKKTEHIVGNSSSSSKPPAAAGAAGGPPDDEKSSSALLPPPSAAAITPRSQHHTTSNKRYPVTGPGHLNMATNSKVIPLSNPKWRRVLLKIGGTALAGAAAQNVDPKLIMLIAREVQVATRHGIQVAIVVGGRNIFCGDSWAAATGTDRAMTCQIGMMASVMNAVLLQASLEKIGVETRVQTALTMQEIAEPYIRRRAVRHLEKGRVVIFGGIGAAIGNPLFTTDTAAALRASEINADVVLKGNAGESVYACPARSSNYATFEHISFRELASRGFTSMDMTAITFCEENNIPVVLFNMLEPGNISRALCGDQVGTLVDQSGRIS